MRKKIIISVLLLSGTQCLVAGIFRHDKTAKDHKELAAQSQFDCVGILYYKTGNAVKPEWHGSCVLIDKKYVLTAAHCIIESLTQEDTIDYEGHQMIVNQPYGEYVRDVSNYSCKFNGKMYKGKTVHIYPSYLNCSSKHKSDIALIELEEMVTGVQPANICHSFDEMHTTIVGVGYGARGKANEPAKVDGEKPLKLAGENMIDSFCGFKVNGQYVSMLCDFDHPSNKAGNKMGNEEALPLEYITSGGDSGGGAFRKTQNGWELVGICGGAEHGGVDIKLLTTEGIGYYNQLMEWQRVSVFADWIDKLIK